ncbi:hypothetical protein [Leptothoe sp. PORK10 BA2]|uniref:hypothetical protein n=1 Tax=Leptothoe sp. PORK10 BA2 TaxID=3110254 RepID=UPI002B1FE3DE|nr:hypothetical protein [Leptothoe sp. PORK10 BA2]MEA5464732.1 hypothetical protein [Leptothoe sp. PORK10 BA2]
MLEATHGFLCNQGALAGVTRNPQRFVNAIAFLRQAWSKASKSLSTRERDLG